MADLVFPTNPTTGERFPDPPMADFPVWVWTGTRWQIKASAAIDALSGDGLLTYGRRNGEWQEVVPILSELNGVSITKTTFIPKDITTFADGYLAFNTAIFKSPIEWRYLDNGIAALMYLQGNDLTFNVMNSGVAGAAAWSTGSVRMDHQGLYADGSITLQGLRATNTTAYALSVNGAQIVSDESRVHFFYANPNYQMYCYCYHRAGVTVGLNFFVGPYQFEFNMSGSAIKAGGGDWVDISDGRIKDVVQDYKTGLESVRKLKPVVYTYKNNDGIERQPSNEEHIGLVAQDCEAAMPEIIKKSSGTIDGQRVDDMRILDPSAITFALINAVKELSAKVKALEKRKAA